MSIGQHKLGDKLSSRNRQRRHGVSEPNPEFVVGPGIVSCRAGGNTFADSRRQRIKTLLVMFAA